MFSWLSILGTGAKWLYDWWKGNEAVKHDNQVRTAQQNVDALQGQGEALKQVDRVSAALDSDGVRVSDDPFNDNR